MADAAHTVDELVEMMARLERKLDAALRAPPKLLSKRAAAKMLGVDRGTTLERWIHSGALRVVEGRIPLPDVERLVADGPPAPPTRRRSSPKPARSDDASAIRDLEV